METDATDQSNSAQQRVDDWQQADLHLKLKLFERFGIHSAD